MFVLSNYPELARNLGQPAPERDTVSATDLHFHLSYQPNGDNESDMVRTYCVAPDCPQDTFFHFNDAAYDGSIDYAIDEPAA
jgi:hypothetical protein